ncbi:MAG TPA: histidine kinase [Chitinophagaceae bacterium]|nr:histidine kinase [Chitinophagaceae bacterium]
MNTAKGVGSARREWITYAMHVLIWLIVFLIPYIFSANEEWAHRQLDPDRADFLYLNTAMNFFWVGIFYLNAGILLPRLIYQRKTGWYVLSLAGLFGLVLLGDSLLFRLLIRRHAFSGFHSVEHNFLPFVFTLAVSAAYKAILDKNRADIRARDLQSENLKTELSFLRSQVSPHFLFNVLNNLVALVRLKSDELEPTVMKLSSLMQYMLYDTDEERVLLKSEVEYLKDYIDLQRLRFGPELRLSVDLDVREDWHAIEPMLLIPFVENAFKHGQVPGGHPQITIRLQAVNHRLDFSVSNRYVPGDGTKDRTPGIGLQNVRRRLELLYPGRHQLFLDNRDGWFTARLQLELKE